MDVGLIKVKVKDIITIIGIIIQSTAAAAAAAYSNSVQPCTKVRRLDETDYVLSIMSHASDSCLMLDYVRVIKFLLHILIIITETTGDICQPQLGER